MSQTQQVFEQLMQLVFPPRCLFCDAILPLGTKECETCAKTAKEHKLLGESRIESYKRNIENLDGLVSSFVYKGQIAEAVARYKFLGKRDLFRDMSKFMAEDCAELLDVESIDFVINVPGYRETAQHTKLLASGVAKLLDKPLCDKVLRKTRKTEKQHNLGAEERAENIKGAFAADAGATAGKTILICDDVATSGNTLNECAAALKSAGAKAVYGLTFSATVAEHID